MTTAPLRLPSYGGIHLADCVRHMKSLPAEGVDLAFADPPFNIGFEYDTYNDSRPQHEYEAWCLEWLTELFRTLHKHGTFWLAIGDEQVAELDVMARKVGFKRRSWVVWHYTFGVNCEKKLTRSHAHLLYYTKHKDEFVFNPQKVPSARQLIYNDKRAKSGGRNPDDTWMLRPQWMEEGFYATDDTWHIPRINGTFKERIGTPNQMPEQLLGRIIRMCSNPGDFVFDPFCGSATTATVAKKLGRLYGTTEESPKYYEFAKARLEAANVGDELDGPIPQGDFDWVPEK